MKNKIKKFNLGLYPAKLFYGPEWIVLGVNNICNLHCKMCDVGTGYSSSNFYYHLMGSQPINMPLDLIKKIIDQTAYYYPKSKIGYAFTEPLIYPHLCESLEYANNKGIYTTVTTNGLNLDKNFERLCHIGLNELFVSLDGPPDVHNKIRGNNRSFESAFEGIRKINSYKGTKPLVSVYFTIMDLNTGVLKNFADLFKDMELKEIGFMHTNFTTKEIAEEHNKRFADSYPVEISNTEGIDISKINIEELFEQINEIRSAVYPFKISFSPELKTINEIKDFYFNHNKKFGRFCNDVNKNIMIKSDGSAIPSHGRCYKVNAGNINKENLKQIWNSHELASFRKTLIREGGLLPACSRCCSAF
jgi:Fe-coproporphyrin III synthase